MIHALNIGAAAITIVLGIIGWLAPGYTMDLLDLKTDGSTMGMSEIRAASGALFIGIGLGALLIGTPAAFAMIGCAYAGAAVGRLTSILSDAEPIRATYIFFAFEAVFGLWLLYANLRLQQGT